MRLVPRYTLVLATTVAAVLSIVGVVRIRVIRGDLENDMQRDHRVIGQVLQFATRDTLELLRSGENKDGARFEWDPTDRRTQVAQQVEGDELVSRFPVRAGDAAGGTVVMREAMSHVDDVVRTQIWHTALGIAVIMLICALASYVMGAWLVGRPVGLLVEQARRIGRREFAAEVAVKRDDELGELAHELQLAAATLSASLAKSAAETEARIAAVEQMRHADRLATVGKLAAGIAHELGTPLSVVSGHAQMIAGGEVTGDAVGTSARAIDHEVTRMGKIVRQLLDFARRKGPEGSTCDAVDIAKRCIGLLLVMAERANVRCVVDGPAVRVVIDEDNLQQVITNLCVNAIHAMPDGGELTIAVARVEGRVRIDVRDTGAGISPELKAHLFEPFFTTKQPGEGTGLGLAVVHGIVADHRGRIEVATGPQGTTFSLFLDEAVS